MENSKNTIYKATETSNSFILAAVLAMIERGRGSSKKQKAVSIGTTILITSLYFFYKRVSTAPKHLRHIPSVNYLQMMKEYCTGEPLMKITKRIVNPVINSKGVYLVICLLLLCI